MRSQTPKAISFSRNNISTRSGSLTIKRAIAESVDSETLSATIWVEWDLCRLTISSMAPTLYRQKTVIFLNFRPTSYTYSYVYMHGTVLYADHRNFLLYEDK